MTLGLSRDEARERGEAAGGSGHAAAIRRIHWRLRNHQSDHR